MIRHITFSETATADLLAQLNDAGKGAQLRIIPRSDDGVAIKFYAAVVGGNSVTGFAEYCDNPTNDSHICPPICP